jgi:hypothetical protein
LRNLSFDLPLARVTKEQYDRMIAEGIIEILVLFSRKHFVERFSDALGKW